MDFALFDRRNYPVVGAAQGYDEWVDTYEDSVLDVMDLRLLERCATIDFTSARRGADLGCGTGRVGTWLRRCSAARIDGIDVSSRMLERASSRDVYDELRQGDLRATGFATATYDLVTISLVDEHLPDVAPLYTEAARLLAPDGRLALVAYHPQFLMTVGMPTHFHRSDGAAVAIETYLHLVSDHVSAGLAAGLALAEMHEGLVDDAYVAAKPKWERHRGTPVSFVMAWRKT